ncbi:hypothetical protein PY257_08565 [Ramlibacter sp. H39-3-26]|uniref:hypothetical protein n=1 Tax=Curvibacter soli TaxID=3031331 RepID=UPI0023DCC2DB|nr:hypothetical protein [Ramlibacter sp. H39-3-26]MDF1485233.1 hypothetical protein [Ramlibacter sp. H39-3-26]
MFDTMRHMKPRLLAHGGVANPRDSDGYRCGAAVVLWFAPCPAPKRIAFIGAAKHRTLHWL